MTRILATPTILFDGTIVSAPGYRQVPDHPTEDQIVAAVKEIHETVLDFSFKNEPARSAWMALLLTRLARNIIDGPIPLFLVDGAHGVGKNLLINTVGWIADGQTVPALRYTGKVDDDERTIFSCLQTDPAMIVFDGIGPGIKIGHDAMNAILTSTQFRARIPGRQDLATCNNKTIWTVAGGRKYLTDDTARRTICIGLDAPLKQTSIKQTMEKQILATRAKLVVSALTLIRGWYAAGRPMQALRPMGSFESWTTTIGQILAWVGTITLPYGLEVVDPILANDQEVSKIDINWSSIARVLDDHERELVRKKEQDLERQARFDRQIHELVTNAIRDFPATLKYALETDPDRETVRVFEHDSSQHNAKEVYDVAMMQIAAILQSSGIKSTVQSEEAGPPDLRMVHGLYVNVKDLIKSVKMNHK